MLVTLRGHRVNLVPITLFKRRIRTYLSGLNNKGFNNADSSFLFLL